MINPAKVFGWLLLVGGVSIILLSLYSSYNIFTAKSSVPEIFEMPLSDGTPASSGTIASVEDIQALLSEQLKKMIPVETLPKLLNLTVWSVLATILIFGGSQISGLGIRLIKS